MATVKSRLPRCKVRCSLGLDPRHRSLNHGLFFLKRRVSWCAGTPYGLFGPITCQASVPKLIPLAGAIGLDSGRCVCGRHGVGPDWMHRDTVDRTWRHTELAARAFIRNHGMHLFCRAKNRVHRTGLNAFRAADAEIFVDQRTQRRCMLAAAGIQRFRRASKDSRKRHNRVWPARRATVDIRLIARDRVGVRATSSKPAAPALRLRQQRVEALGQIGIMHAGILADSRQEPVHRLSSLILTSLPPAVLR
jgi:hypothetical protein